jgi:hypothetical protein
MYELINVIRDLVDGRPHPEVAKAFAYLLAPALVLSLAAVSSGGHGLGFDVLGPMSVAMLQSEMSSDGSIRAKPGVAVIMEPVGAELRIPIEGSADRVWSSLDESTLRANRDRLRVDGGGFVSHAPLMGVNAPVTMVVEGRLGSTIQTVGGTDPISNWTLPARRAVSILSSVLLACVFAFGMAFAAVVPSIRSDQSTRRQAGAQPH